LPSQSELNDMINRFSGVNFSVSMVVSEDIYNKFISLYGVTAQSTGTAWKSSAWYEKDSGEIQVVGISKNKVMYNTGYTNSTNITLSTTGYAHFGIWLVNDGGLSIKSIGQPEINIPAIN
jgi:hypothetical protein